MRISPGAAAVLLVFALLVIASGVGFTLLVVYVGKATRSRARTKAADLQTFLNASGAAYLPAVLCTRHVPIIGGTYSVELWLLPGRLFLQDRGLISEYATGAAYHARSIWDRPAHIAEVRVDGADVRITFFSEPNRQSALTLHGLPDHVRAQLVAQLR